MKSVHKHSLGQIQEAFDMFQSATGSPGCTRKIRCPQGILLVAASFCPLGRNTHSTAKVQTSCEAVPDVLLLTVSSTVVILTHVLLSMHAVPQACVTHFVTCPVILLCDNNFSQRAQHMSMVMQHFSCPSFILQAPCYSETQLSFISLISSKTPRCQHSPAIWTLFLQLHQYPIKSCSFFPFSCVKRTKQRPMRHTLLLPCAPCMNFILPEFCTFI